MHKSKNIVHINTKAKRSQTSCLQEVWPFYSLTSVKDGIITFFTHFVYWKSYVQVLSDMKAVIQKTLPAAGRLFAAGRVVYSIPNAR